MTQTDHLALAKEALAIAGSPDARREAYKRAAKHILAYRNTNPRGYRQAVASYCNTSVGTVDKLVQWAGKGYKADTPFLADDEATKRAERSHAKALVADPNEAAKFVASLPAETRQTLAKAVMDNPAMRRDIGDEQMRSLSHGRVEGANSLRLPHELLRRIESDRLKLKSAAETMAGHWHDHRHDADDEEVMLARDSMAQAVIEVERIVTDALRDPDKKEART